MPHEIEVAQSSQLSIASGPAPVAKLIEAVLKNGMTSESVGVVERLVGLYERLEQKEAEKQFAAAFVALQSEMPKVIAERSVPDRNGGTKFVFAAFEDIMRQVQPLLLKHGFTLTFSMDIKEDRVIQNCTLMHVGGHSRTNQFMAKIGSGPPGASGAQADGAASTYAKRFALCNALNIVIERDTDGRDDARNEGEPITFEQSQYLKDLVVETNSDEAKFLAFAGAKHYDEIGSTKYQMLVSSLLKKQQRR